MFLKLPSNSSQFPQQLHQNFPSPADLRNAKHLVHNHGEFHHVADHILYLREWSAADKCVMLSGVEALL